MILLSTSKAGWSQALPRCDGLAWSNQGTSSVDSPKKAAGEPSAIDPLKLWQSIHGNTIVKTSPASMQGSTLGGEWSALGTSNLAPSIRSESYGRIILPRAPVSATGEYPVLTGRPASPKPGMWPGESNSVFRRITEEDQFAGSSTFKRSDATRFGVEVSKVGQPGLHSDSIRGLEPSFARFAKSIESTIPKATTASADWDRTLVAMRALPASMSTRLLEQTELAVPLDQLQLLKLSDVHLRVARARSMAETSVALLTIYPDEVVDELLFRRPTHSSMLNANSLLDEKRIAFQQERINLTKGYVRKAGLFRGGDPTVQSVGVGGQTPPGGLSGVPAGIPVRMNREQKCLTLSTAADRLLDPKSLRVGRDWDPIAFPDVGLLLKRKSGTGLSNIKICSFVRISKNELLTAAHCAAIETKKGEWQPMKFDSPEVEAIALIPNLSVEKKLPAQCFDTPSNCGFFVAKVVGQAQFPKEIKWSGVTPVPDISLIGATFKNSPEPTTPLSSAIEKKELTLAGYGLTNAGGGQYSGYLQVGWNRMPKELDEAVIAWDVLPANGNAGGCVGDSGGAVFAGSVAGPNDKRELVGLISFGHVPASVSGIDQCMASVTGIATRLKAHVPWICEKTSYLAKGCLP